MLVNGKLYARGRRQAARLTPSGGSSGRSGSPGGGRRRPRSRRSARWSQATAWAAAGHVGVEEGEEEMADREDVGEVDDPARQLVVGDEDAGEEVERQQQEVDDRGGGVLGRDRRGEGDAEAGEGGGADAQDQQDLRDPAPRGSGRRRRGRRSARAGPASSSAVTIELPTRPAMKTQEGIGVPRPRFSRPSSRAITSDIASVCMVEEMIAMVMIAGT